MDLSFLSPLSTISPIATVYLDVSHDTPDAARAVGLRWTSSREELAAQGADDATVAALDEAFAGADPVVGQAGRVLVAGDGRVLLDQTLPEPPARPGATWSTVPDVVPLLVEQPEPMPAVVVRVDETGGEILAGGRPDELRGEEVGTDAYPVHKVRGGGWNHLNMQERVEENWLRNTRAVAERVDKLVAGLGARVLVVAGSGPARSRLRDALGERSAAIAVDVEARDADPVEAARAAIQDVVEADRHATLERWGEAAGRGLGVEGVRDTLAAFRSAAVEVLLLDLTVPRDVTVAIAADPVQLAVTEQELRDAGSEPVGTAPLDPALVRAAAASGASFVRAYGGRPLTEGVGALLRFPLPVGA